MERRAIERLRSGRGKAIKGQKRGRGLEDFAEAIVRRFSEINSKHVAIHRPAGQKVEMRLRHSVAKSRSILIEPKGYGATGSKMTDILGDINRSLPPNGLIPVSF